MTLREKRILFTRLISEFKLWIFSEGWEVAQDEGTVLSPRAARRGMERLSVDDAVHKRNSFHHQGLAEDLNLYREGAYVFDGNDPIWIYLADKWESMNPLCTAGLRFQDANHFSLGEGR